MKVKSLSRVQLSATPWTVTHQAPPSMGFSRQEYWSGVPLPSPMEEARSIYSYKGIPRPKKRKTVHYHFLSVCPLTLVVFSTMLSANSESVYGWVLHLDTIYQTSTEKSTIPAATKAFHCHCASVMSDE